MKISGSRLRKPGYVNPATEPGLVPYDLTEGGHYLTFAGGANIDEYAWYAQDSITVGNLTLNGGLRVDVYHGLSHATADRAARRHGVSREADGHGEFRGG